MNEPIELYEASFTFTQEPNCMNHDAEELVIKCRSDLGIDSMGGCFYELKTECWSIDSIENLRSLFERIEKAIFPQIKKD